MSHSPRDDVSPVPGFPADGEADAPLAATDRSNSLLLLTPRERDVLDWVAAGKTNRQVASILGTSPRTVQKHLEHVFAKLGVESRLAAVMRALSLARGGAR